MREMAIRIVIVDDHKIFIDGIRSLLTGVADMEVVGEAVNGKEAIRLAEQLTPDVVLMDIQMPEQDGIETTSLIVRSFPQIKILALSMMDESHSIRKMLEAGASGYVLKTINKEELVEVIRKVSSGQKHFSQEVTEQLINNFTRQQVRIEDPINLLTNREKEILAFIAQGLTDKEIAGEVFLSPYTVITHRKNILSKLGLKNKVELTRFALKHRIGE